MAVVGALGVVAAPKAVYSAMFLAATMIILAVLYIAQDALFLGVVQIVVYTGAVMMLFLFVLMLIGVDSSESLVETIRGQRIAAIAVGVGFGVLLIAGIGNVSAAGFTGLAAGQCRRQRRGPGRADLHPVPVGVRADRRAADHRALGAMVLAHRERFERRKTQREMAARAFPAGRAPDADCPIPVCTPGTTRSTCRPGCPTDRVRSCRSAPCCSREPWSDQRPGGDE